jgi:hypothetical protein
MKQAKRTKFVVTIPTEPIPPVYTPNPESTQVVLRCCRDSCRCIIPAGATKCISCGCMITSTEPLNRLTIYIEEF